MDWGEQAGMEAAEYDRVMDEERWKTVQLMGILDKLYSERLVLIRHIGHHEAAWAARTGRVVVLTRERARVNEIDHRIYWAQLIIKQRQEEVHPIQHEKTCCGRSAPVPSPPSRLSPVPSRPSPAPPLLPQQSAVSSQALLVSPLPSQQSQQVRGEEEASRKVDDEQVVWNESEKKESEYRDEDERKEEPPQQQEHDPSKANCGPELTDLFGAGGEGAGQQQLIRRQQRQQQQSQAKEGRAANLSVESREEVERGDEVVRDREYVVDTEEDKVDEQVEEKMDDGGCSAEGKHPLQEKLELVLAKKCAKSLPQQQQQQPKHEGLLPPPPWPPPLSSQKGNVNGEIRDHGTGWFGVEIGVTGGVLGGLVGGLVSMAWWRGYGTRCSVNSGSETDGSESERTGQG